MAGTESEDNMYQVETENPKSVEIEFPCDISKLDVMLDEAQQGALNEKRVRLALKNGSLPDDQSLLTEIQMGLDGFLEFVDHLEKHCLNLRSQSLTVEEDFALAKLKEKCSKHVDGCYRLSAKIYELLKAIDPSQVACHCPYADLNGQPFRAQLRW